MFKKLTCCIFAVICISFFWAQNVKPTFKDYSTTFTLYLNSPSSTALMVNATTNDFFLHTDVKGESCIVCKDGVTAESVINDFDAKPLFIERVGETVNYYCYSEQIKYAIDLNGKTVNLHISVSERGINLGSPIIFGSF